MADWKPDRPKWQAQPDDAIKLAAFRWFALELESTAIEIYATDSSKYERLIALMRKAMHEIETMRQEFTADDGECPPGYTWCRFECAPMCYEEEE